MITKAKTFDATKISYKEPVVNKKGGKSVQLNLDGQPIVLQIPLMLTWGVNERVDEQSGRISYDMALQFNDDSPTVLKFLEALKVLENKIKTDSCDSMCKKWHGKSKMSREVIDALMYPILKYPRLKDSNGQPTSDPDYNRFPTMKLKVPFWDGNFAVELYNMERKALYLPDGNTDPSVTPVTAIPKASNVKGLIQCTGMWFAGGKCGVTWKIVQLCVRPPARLLGSGTCHLLDDSDDEEEEKEEEEEEVEELQGPSFDDDDDDVVEDKEEAPKKKKVVRKKKVKKSDD
tara:strand:+ start:5518 stop:6384 length:867 start_codon:yes stop_codon:yes gene_type:complete